MGEGARAVALVEGISDQVALEALAERRGLDLDAERVRIVPMGGATNIGRFLARFGPSGAGVTVAGVCDAGEEGAFRRALELAGLGAGLDRARMEELGFFVCVEDLEDELIRAVGVPGVEAVIAAQGELATFRTFQNQPAQRARSTEAHLRRFMGTKSGRKIRYPRLLVDVMDLGAVPRPLDAVLDHVRSRDVRPRPSE